MKYYRPTKEVHDYFTGYTTVEGELLTEKERNTKFRYLDDKFFETVEVSRKKTYWMFGARFPMAEAKTALVWDGQPVRSWKVK